MATLNTKDFAQVFLAESDELLSDFEQGLIALETRPDDAEHINRVFRTVHTLKSGAGMFALEPIVAIAHAGESVLDRVRSRELVLDKSLIDLLLSALDAFRELLEQFAAGAPVKLEQRHVEIVRRFERYTPVKPSNSKAAPPPKAAKAGSTSSSLRVLDIQVKFGARIFDSGQDPSLLILELAQLGEILSLVADTSSIPTLERFNPTQCYLGWHLTLRTEQPRSKIDDVFLFVADSSEVTVTDISTTSKSLHDFSTAELKIGELLVENCQIREDDVNQALTQQKRLGQLLVDMGKVTPQTLNEALHKQQRARQLVRSSTIRVDTDKLDSLVNLVGELAIAIAQVNESARKTTSYDDTHKSSLEGLERIGRELQAQIMSTRMVTIEETFNRFKRTVRDTAAELGKNVILETAGTDTELDKIVIEQLADPLKHMIRNAVAHGIEAPADRIRMGKSDTGCIHLSASQQQGQVVIEVRDNGRGINSEAVLRKARQLGLVRSTDVLTEKQILGLLFEPGFSTAEQVNEISGRGVGLDVVMQNVKHLRGSVDVESHPGQGTTFRIKLPLTLAIIEGMNVKVGQETMTIPMVSVVELISPRAEQMATVEGKGELVEVRGEYMPVVRLKELLDAGDSERALTVDTVVVVVEAERRKFGILVDRVLGLEQAVVKPLQKTFSVVQRLEKEFEKPEGVAGATILGNGDVALILDVPGLERMAFGTYQ